MKRLIILLIIIVSSSAYSQKRSGFGIHAGSNSTGVYDITNGYYDEEDPSPGYLVGLRYNLKLGPLGLSAEANYNVINYKSPPTFGFNDISSDINLNYLSIPILLKFYIGGFNLHLGTQISSLIGGSNQLSDDINSDENYVNINGNDEWIYNDTDVAGVVGLGLDTKMGLYFSLRSVVSTSTIGNTSVYEDFFGFNSDDLLKLVTGSFIVGYQF